MENFPSKTIYSRNLTLLFTTVIVLVLSVFLVASSRYGEPEYALNIANSTDNSHDMLVYISDEYYLMTYDPLNHTETMLLDEEINHFAISRDSRVAFTRQDENDHDIYLYDPSMPDAVPINITQNPGTIHYPLAWSPDGRYLAFSSYQDRREETLYVWDGENIINIMPENGLDTAYNTYVKWSHDGRLAFTALDHPSSNWEIYVWDGNTTTNLSQDEDSSDVAIGWSRSGQLLFRSYRDREIGFYVWDGVSFKDGTPDSDTFIHLAPGLNPGYVTWTQEGYLSFAVRADFSPSGVSELVVWDLETEAIVRQIAGWGGLSPDGETIWTSSLASGRPAYYLDIKNTDGETLLSTVVGEFSWSSDGYLAYCRFDYESEGFTLYLWDGEESRDITLSNYKPILWQSVQDRFSCNSG